MVEAALRQLNLTTRKPTGLYAPIEYAMEAGGKRLRPVLALMACEAFCGDCTPALRAAAGLEMYHNFTLLHDDVMDNSAVRRGRPSVYSRYGLNTAILSGDAMLTLATQLVADVADDKLRRVLETFNTMAMEVDDGQQLDVDFETAENVSVDEYITMIGAKTGSLLGASLKIGSLIGGASEADAEAMHEFGMMLGLAFQIQDDWLDTFGNAATFGKPIGGDISNRKKTYLYVSGMARGGADADALGAAMDVESAELRVKTVTRLYEKLGLGEECKRAVAFYSAKAMGALRRTSMGEEARDAFRKVAEKLVGREK